jgi:ornithine cyclodeaminase
MGMQEGRFGADHILAELGEVMESDDGTGITRAGRYGRRSDADVTIFKSLGLAVEDVTAADLAYRRAVERNVGQELML